MIQGKNNCLFQIITATIVELYDDSQVEQILKNAYRISIKKDAVKSDRIWTIKLSNRN